jgi:hypothetical protein
MSDTVCQSCGIPISDELYSRDSNGRINKNYCKHCYENGHFTFNGSMEEMAEICAEYMTQQCHDKDANLKFMRSILPKLDRWK